MIRHVLLFRFWPTATLDERERVVAELRSLKGRIPEIMEWSIGTQAFPSEKAHDFAQVSSFADKAALERFRQHPAHVQVRGLLSQLCDWALVDYELDETEP
jgi:hypothetical protein